MIKTSTTKGDIADLRYNIRDKRGNDHITVDKFQFKPGKLTIAAKMLPQKDLSQVIYDRTVVGAIINVDKISYKIAAIGKK